MSKCNLPFVKPLLTSYDSYTFTPFAGIYDEQFKLWFIHNFISLRCGCSYGNRVILYDDLLNQVRVDTCPLFRKEVVQRSTIIENNNLLAYIKCQISKGYYVFLSLDCYHNPHRGNLYKKIHFNHTSLIIGYNDEDEEFDIVDFFGDYMCKKIGYTDLYNGFYSYDIDHLLNHYEVVASVKYDSNFIVKYYYRPQLLKNTLIYYMNGDKQGEDWFGKYSYDVIRECVKGNNRFEKRQIHSVYDHKVAMKYRVRFLSELKLIEISEEQLGMFNDLETNSLSLRNVVFKYMSTNNDRLLNRINELCSKIEHYEQHLIKLLLELI